MSVADTDAALTPSAAFSDSPHPSFCQSPVTYRTPPRSVVNMSSRRRALYGRPEGPGPFPSSTHVSTLREHHISEYLMEIGGFFDKLHWHAVL